VQRSPLTSSPKSVITVPGLCHRLAQLSHTSGAQQGFIPREFVRNEVAWFYTQLGIDDTYFTNESPDVISDHVLALYGAKVLAFTKHDPTKLVIDLERIDENGEGATFIHTSAPGVTALEGPGATCESRYVIVISNHWNTRSDKDGRIDTMFLDHSTPENAFRLETFRSNGSVSSTASQQLRCYFVTKCIFPTTPPTLSADGKTEIKSVSDAVFLEKATPHTLDIYQEVMWSVESRYGPVIEVFEVEGSRERRIVIGYKMGGTSRFFRYAFFSPDVMSRASPYAVLCRTFIITTPSTRLANMSVSLTFQILLPPSCSDASSRPSRAILKRNHHHFSLS
jgi:NAD-specific glutamate dehydrogenase